MPSIILIIFSEKREPNILISIRFLKFPEVIVKSWRHEMTTFYLDRNGPKRDPDLKKSYRQGRKKDVCFRDLEKEASIGDQRSP